jgi:hypothetical protein
MVTYPGAPDKPVQRYKFYAQDLTTRTAGSTVQNTTTNPTSVTNVSEEVEQEWTVNTTVAKEFSNSRQIIVGQELDYYYTR